MTKITKLPFCQKIYFLKSLLHANVQCVYIVYERYHIVSAKVVVQVDFSPYALSIHACHTKWLSLKSGNSAKKYFFA